ncbi:MAG: hypothetical protein HOH82_13165, partial [Planctomycetaceae bacterium]|nr:hypothetical protein [Planctomycetaceae bacterium]
MKRITRRLLLAKPHRRRSIWGSILVALAVTITAQLQQVSAETLQFQPLGKPTEKKAENARKINELKFFEGRLYLGHGDWFKNSGPTDVISYDFSKQKFVKEHTVQDEAIHRYRQYGNRLFLPGTDATESWEFGNLYVHEASAWKKHRTIPRGLHVFDFAEYDGRWFVGTGSYFNDTRKGPWIGAIYSSKDHAKSWQYEYTTASSTGTASRITALMPFKGRLFAFGYRDGPMPKETNPKPSTSKKTKQYNRVAKSVVYDGVGWFPANLIPATPLVQTIEPAVFADQLLLIARSGRYGRKFKNKWLLFAHDGKTTRQLPLDCDRIVDTLVKPDRLILLLERDGKHVLVESTDLVHWSTHPLDPKIERPLSVEFDGKSYYLGLTDGTILAAPVS